jgi:hypothetical protein
VDYCYNKEGWARIASDPDNLLAGWCRDWKHQNTGESERMTGQKTYFTGASVTQASCIDRCNENVNCAQAVFEASGPWGPQCWLGHKASNLRPKSSRPCSKYPKQPCVDFCYNKAGWAPRLGAVHVVPGWCRDWKHQNTGESMRMTGQQTYFTGKHVTQASCIQKCNEAGDACHQAVFEASGPWGPQCWLGTQKSTVRPTGSRPCTGKSVPCVDYCYNKEGYARIASDPDNVLPGWCRNWKHQNTGESMRMTGQQTYFTGNTVTLKTCMAKCHENASCKQAVFEASGHWGPQCWLGTQASSARPTGSRPCSKYPNEPCVDFCFSKSGWATMEEQQLQSTVDDLLDVQEEPGQDDISDYLE